MLKMNEGRKKPSSARSEAVLICVDKLQATKVVITGVYTPISNRDKQWSPLLAFKVCLQPISARRFHPHVQPQPFGISNTLWSFTKHICPSPLRAPDHTAAWATGFICDHRQFVTALSLSLRGFLQNILIIPYKISILMILLWTEIRSCGGWDSFAEFKPHAHSSAGLHFLVIPLCFMASVHHIIGSLWLWTKQIVWGGQNASVVFTC